MAWEQPLWRITSFVAGEDLSDAQYTFVKVSADNTVVQCDAVTDEPLGVLQNDPESGEEAEVMVIGVTKLVASAAIARMANLGTAATGEAVTIDPDADGDTYICGRALEAAAAADEIIPAMINCCVPVHNAKS